MVHVINVHRWPQLFAFRASSLFQDSFSLLLGKTRKTGQRWRVVGPVRNRRDWLDPYRCATQPRIGSQLTAPIARRVALRALCDFFHQVTAALDLAFFTSAR